MANSQRRVANSASEALPNRAALHVEWTSINWKHAEQLVSRLQARIAKAAAEKKWRTVKKLQYLLAHSRCAKLLAVRKVTTNKGKRTPGVDKVLWSTPAQKMKAALCLTDKGYKAKPLKRVYIEKKGKKEKRPLGIPTMHDRAMQALYAIGLDPVAEVTADKRSFGFRKGRSCHDAMQQIFICTAAGNRAEWVLEGDIKGCFDHISHDWLLENVPMDKTVLKQFLKAGYVYGRDLFPTDEGTPQGGVISPILANLALDGIEDFLHANYKGQKVNLIRYADDLVITAVTYGDAINIKAGLTVILLTRGLELSPTKTLITHINDGYDLIGWNFRKYKGKLLIKPSKKAIKSITSTLSEKILRKGKALPQKTLIILLNQTLRGWGNYHQPVCAKETFSHVDYILFKMLWQWAKRRHPKKGKRWIAAKYWHQVGNRKWVFCDGDTKLISLSDIKIIRHTALKLDKNPYLDPEYFSKRKLARAKKHLSSPFKEVWTRQKGLCHLCGLPMDSTEDYQYEIVNVTASGVSCAARKVLTHKHCFELFCESRPKG
ncbi:MAG: group II intron reverse transcriptase/maturase [Clostridiales bacterium]|jgi:RNA-directed DNA polymerase|nr:group II intron reverse transcriptase/maturase [Clostridiales bacterium]